MILGLLLGTIAATLPAGHAPPIPTVSPPLAPVPRLHLACRGEFGMGSLVRRYRVCHASAEWRQIDARRRDRRTGR